MLYIFCLETRMIASYRNETFERIFQTKGITLIESEKKKDREKREIEREEDGDREKVREMY